MHYGRITESSSASLFLMPLLPRLIRYKSPTRRAPTEQPSIQLHCVAAVNFYFATRNFMDDSRRRAHRDRLVLVMLIFPLDLRVLWLTREFRVVYLSLIVRRRPLTTPRFSSPSEDHPNDETDGYSHHSHTSNGPSHDGARRRIGRGSFVNCRRRCGGWHGRPRYRRGTRRRRRGCLRGGCRRSRWGLVGLLRSHREDSVVFIFGLVAPIQGEPAQVAIVLEERHAVGPPHCAVFGVAGPRVSSRAGVKRVKIKTHQHKVSDPALRDLQYVPSWHAVILWQPKYFSGE